MLTDREIQGDGTAVIPHVFDGFYFFWGRDPSSFMRFSTKADHPGSGKHSDRAAMSFTVYYPRVDFKRKHVLVSHHGPYARFTTFLRRRDFRHVSNVVLK